MSKYPIFATGYQVGQEVTWLYSPRGGYGYVVPVNGRVLAVHVNRVQIEVQRATGELVSRWVTTEHLRPRVAS